MSTGDFARSCDSFVVLPPLTDSNMHIYGKNSDRVSHEVQEVIFVGKEHTADNKNVVTCTHIQIPQVSKTYRCILTKPAWCWGAEMGANEHGLCLGNEAVHTKLPYEPRENALTGLDIVRLALERCKTAKAAVELIGQLVETYGQGGRCFPPDYKSGVGYDSNFLVADAEEAWTVETCDRVWVAKQIKEGYYNMSNLYAIEDDYTLQSNNLQTFAKEHNFWDGKGKLNFATTFQDPTHCDGSRFKNGRALLAELTKNGNFSALDMISILRDEPSGICLRGDGDGFRTTASQVSVLMNKTSQQSHQLHACHFFTATPNPKTSLFKPFIFSDKVELGPLTVSPPANLEPSHAHPLYVMHRDATKEQLEDKRLRDFERDGILEILAKLKSSDDKKSADSQADTYETLFHDTVSAEIELLRLHPATKRY